METLIRWIEKLAVFFFGALAAAYLLNPTFGFIEFIPDYWPIVGNLDEAAAVALLLNCLRYFGLDLTRFFVYPGKLKEVEAEIEKVDEAAKEKPE